MRRKSSRREVAPIGCASWADRRLNPLIIGPGLSMREYRARIGHINMVPLLVVFLDYQAGRRHAPPRDIALAHVGHMLDIQGALAPFFPGRPDRWLYVNVALQIQGGAVRQGAAMDAWASISACLLGQQQCFTQQYFDTGQRA